MASKKFYTYYQQKSQFSSPHPAGVLLALLLWQWVWACFCSWTPKPLNGWRLLCLRIFGAKLYGRPFVHPRARIEVPWNLTMHDRACLGDRAHAYSLGKIELKQRSTVAQESYLCTGTHDFTHPILPLQTACITVGEDAFLGARSFIMPGVSIGTGTVIGACSLVTNDMPDWTYCFGHPCKPIKERRIILPDSTR